MRRMTYSDVNKFFRRRRKELVGRAGLVGLVGLVSAVLFVLWQLGQITLDGQVTLVQIITGILVLVGMYWTSRRVRAAEETVRVAEEGQVTERFTRAIAQLGDKEMAIRLGGIYALERIAKDSEKDHGPIMEVLTAYVREKATKQGRSAAEAAQKPTTDIQAVLTVIIRRTRQASGHDRIDLNNTHLAGGAMHDTDLCSAILSGANLSGANLIYANLSGALLDKATLSGALLMLADLSWANLRGANLRGALLDGANLEAAKNLTEEQVRSARSCSGAILPDYLPDSVKDLTKRPAWPA